jgi:CubicO group peptidase (beta-lactamase class C family)
LSNGKPAYLVRFRAADGKERSKQFSRRRDAEHFAHVTEVDRMQGSFVDPRLGRLTVTEWYEQWWPTVTNLRPSTRGSPIGGRPGYSEYVSYALLGKIIYDQTGRMIDEHLRDLIQQALGPGSGLHASFGELKSANIAVPAAVTAEGLLPLYALVVEPYASFFSPGTMAWGSATELARFAQSVLSGALLSSASLALLTVDSVHDYDEHFARAMSYTHGLIYDLASIGAVCPTDRVGVGLSAAGGQSFLAMFPEDGSVATMNFAEYREDNSNHETFIAILGAIRS